MIKGFEMIRIFKGDYPSLRIAITCSLYIDIIWLSILMESYVYENPFFASPFDSN